MAEVDINFHFQVPYSCQETKRRETAWASCIINKCRGESLMRVGMEKRVFGLCGDINSIEETACNCFYRWIQWKPLMVTSCDLNWQLIRPVDAMWDASSLNWLAENTRWVDTKSLRRRQANKTPTSTGWKGHSAQLPQATRRASKQASSGSEFKSNEKFIFFLMSKWTMNMS